MNCLAGPANPALSDGVISKVDVVSVPTAVAVPDQAPFDPRVKPAGIDPEVTA